MFFSSTAIWYRLIFIFQPRAFVWFFTVWKGDDFVTRVGLTKQARFWLAFFMCLFLVYYSNLCLIIHSLTSEITCE